MKHNLHKSKLYSIWIAMRQRCNNPNNKYYKYYGNRGIKVCEDWDNIDNGFINFYQWSNDNGYQERLSIDRIDNNANYLPSNCRWITQKKQMRNRRNTIFIIYNNEQVPLVDLCENLGLNYHRVLERLHQNWTLDKAIKTDKIQPSGNHTSELFFTMNNETHSLSQWCKIYNLDYILVWNRMHKSHWTFEKAITTPITKNKSHPKNH